jgi:hypothetical protein
MATELTDWRHSAEPYAGKHKVLAVIKCPNCKQEWILSGNVHQVSRDGTVTPSVVCPCDDCDFHEYVTLKDWTFPDWFMTQTMNGFVADIQANGI